MLSSRGWREKRHDPVIPLRNAVPGESGWPGQTRPGQLDKPQPLEGGVPFLADDDAVVHGNAERAPAWGKIVIQNNT
jgi:hypothetical protein